MSNKAARSEGLPLMRRLLIMGMSGFAVLSLAVMALGLWAVWTYRGPGPEAAAGQYSTVVLRRGAGLNEIASSLERGGVIRSGAIFKAAAQVTGVARDLKAGEYEFVSGASMARVLDDIRAGRVVRHQVTIPEGATSETVIELLNAEEALTGIAPTPPEGTVLPETYDFQRGEDRAAVLQRMMDAHDKLSAQLWAQRQPGLPYTTLEEAVILASRDIPGGVELMAMTAEELDELSQDRPAASAPAALAVATAAPVLMPCFFIRGSAAARHTRPGARHRPEWPSRCPRAAPRCR